MEEKKCPLRFGVYQRSDGFAPGPGADKCLGEACGAWSPAIAACGFSALGHLGPYFASGTVREISRRLADAWADAGRPKPTAASIDEYIELLAGHIARAFGHAAINDAHRRAARAFVFCDRWRLRRAGQEGNK